MAGKNKLVKRISASGDDKKTEKKEAKTNNQSQGQILVQAMAAAVEKAVSKGLTDVVAKQDESNQKILQTLESLAAGQKEVVEGLSALALGTVDAEAETVSASDDASDASAMDAKSDDASDASAVAASDDDASMAARKSDDATDATDDATDATAYAAADDAADPTSYSAPEQDAAEPGNLNPDATSDIHQNIRKRLKPGGKSISKGIAASKEKRVARPTKVVEIAAAAKLIREIRAEKEKVMQENARLKNRVQAIEASLERYADRVERKSVTPEIQALLEKSGYDVRELISSRQKLSVNDVDQMFASSGIPLEPQMRAAFKNQLLQVGLMDAGEVRRWN